MKNNKDLKNTISADSSIKYSGNVTILYKSKNGRYKAIRRKNSGKLPLFNFLVNALDGKLFVELLPKYLFGRCKEDDGSYTDGFIQPVAKLSSNTFYSVNDPTFTNPGPNEADVIEYVFLLPLSNLSSSKAINRLQLLNSDMAVCAEINLDEDSNIRSDLSGASNALIYWRLKFSSSGSENISGTTTNPPNVPATEDDAIVEES